MNGTADTTLICKHCCGRAEPDLTWVTFSNFTQHIEAHCPSCHRHIQYVSKQPHDPWLRLMPPPPEIHIPEQGGLPL